jgi:acyl-CoA synthetase (AMP-forming)/AMP-acid ligase II
MPSGPPLLQVDYPSDARQLEPQAVDEDAAAVYVFTSGTATRPKAVLLRHRQLAAYVLNSVEPLQEPSDAASLIAAPNYHIAVVANLLTSTYSGRRMVLLDEFSPDRWLEIARRESVTHAFVVPTMLHRIVAYLGDRPADVPHLATLAYGGAPVARHTLEAALRAFPSTGFVNAYGLTETSSTVSLLGPNDHRLALESNDPATRDRLGSVGRPLPQIEVQIAPDGEILVRGDQVSGQYLDGGGRVSETDWFHTGDVGGFDADGYLYLLGRTDDVIIRGGENISPAEIEEVLREYPGVRDAVVIGVPDQEWGQRIAAAIEADHLDAGALAIWLQDRLPSFKRPATYQRVDELPRNDLGKLLRRVVREQLQQ